MPEDLFITCFQFGKIRDKSWKLPTNSLVVYAMLAVLPSQPKCCHLTTQTWPLELKRYHFVSFWMLCRWQFHRLSLQSRTWFFVSAPSWNSIEKLSSLLSFTSTFSPITENQENLNILIWCSGNWRQNKANCCQF